MEPLAVKSRDKFESFVAEKGWLVGMGENGQICMAYMPVL